jgi:hypothetical protein
MVVVEEVVLQMLVYMVDLVQLLRKMLEVVWLLMMQSRFVVVLQLIQQELGV